MLESCELVWKSFRSSDQKIPSDAVLVDGSEVDPSQIKKMYVGVVNLQGCSSHGPYGDVVPGYVQHQNVDNEEKYTTTVYYAHNGKAIKVDADNCELKILTNPTNLKLVWRPDFEGHIPENAIGYKYVDDENDAVVYIGRSINRKIIGRVVPYQKCLYFPDFEKNMEEKIGAYGVLCVAKK